MEDFVLLGGFAAIVILGYFVVARVDLFLEKVRRQNAEQGGTPPLNIATSSFNAIPSVINILNDMEARHPDVQYNLCFGPEQEVIRVFEVGGADVAIVSAQAESRGSAQRKDITIDPQPAFMAGGSVALKAFDQAPQDKKVLWKDGNAHVLTAEFVRQFCGY